MSTSTPTLESNYDTKNQVSKARVPNRHESERFLTLLDEDAEQFTFQTFVDDKNARAGELARVLHGSLDDHWDTLCALNAHGAGIFVTVNATDGQGRTKENITRVRAIWQEADHGDEPALPIDPHIIVESSPGKHHRYMLVEDAPIEEFAAVEQRLVDEYGADPYATDLARVLRLPASST